jgi:hypothetical protein
MLASTSPGEEAQSKTISARHGHSGAWLTSVLQHHQQADFTGLVDIVDAVNGVLSTASGRLDGLGGVCGEVDIA